MIGTRREWAYADAGPLRRFVRRSAGAPPLRRLYIHIQEPLDRFVYALTRGRATLSSYLSGLPIVMLTTTGARSGRTHTLPVLAIPDGDTLIVIASNFGRPRNPAWYHNLRSHPRATVTAGHATWAVEAQVLTGQERERQYRRGIEMYPPFAGYRRHASNRQIPVLRLHPSAGPPPDRLRRPRARSPRPGRTGRAR